MSGNKRAIPKIASELRSFAEEKLIAYAADIDVEPQVNSVKRLAFDLSNGLSKEEIDLNDVSNLLVHLEQEEVANRVARLKYYHYGTESKDIASLVKAEAAKGWSSFKARFERNSAGIVFTAHPTFALSKAERGYLIAAASGEKVPPRPKDDHKSKLTLVDEHQAIIAALDEARRASRSLNSRILDSAAEHFPNDWRTIRPQFITLATWVGYDLDGRTDIHWSQSIAFKLEEKTRQLAHYRDALQALGEGFEKHADLFALATGFAEQQWSAFKESTGDTASLIKAANILTEDAPGRLTDLTPIVTELETRLSALSETKAKELILLLSEMQSLGLGVARIHLRVNAAQVRGAVRADLNVDEGVADFGRVAFETAAKRVADTQSLRINFANIVAERMTARRQFMLCAQILKHIDAATPIRFLIAECERPATVMGAIYLAKLYGVEHKVDISPLFETPEAIERGGRFMEQLLDEPRYIDYTRARGTIAIQIGYSDSGRFMGQIVAGMAAERLQIQLAKGMAKRGVCDIGVTLFNTHGESMGRGAHPSDFVARLDHLFTPWARSRYAHEAIAVTHETSFQGGDGVVHFGNQQLAKSSLEHVFRHALCLAERDASDQFYRQLSFSWDVYRGLKAWQEELFADIDYRTSLSAFATQMLVDTGSRKAKRAAAAEGDLSKVRAIPNNAALQQIAVPANVVGGIGSVVTKERDRFVSLVANSGRMRGLMVYAATARDVTSIPALRAYSSLYDASAWLARAALANEPDKAAMMQLARHLRGHSVHLSLTRFADHLSSDLIYLDQLLDDLSISSSAQQRHTARVPLHIIHACRIALINQAFILIAKLPKFSRRHDVSREDIIEMVLQLKVKDAITQLEQVFPLADEASEIQNALSEPADDDGAYEHGYAHVRATIINPLRQLLGIVERTSVLVSHHYSAWG